MFTVLLTVVFYSSMLGLISQKLINYNQNYLAPPEFQLQLKLASCKSSLIRIILIVSVIRQDLLGQSTNLKDNSIQVNPITIQVSR